jgi:hypothetical protein
MAVACAPQPAPRITKQLPSELKTGARPTVYIFEKFPDKIDVPGGLPWQMGVIHL